MQQILSLIKRMEAKNFEERYPEYKPDDGKVHVLFLSPYASGVGLYRTILPYLHLNETTTHSAILNGLRSWKYEDQFHDYEEHIAEDLFKWAHYIVMPTVMSDIRPAITNMLKKNPKLKFAIDIDDNYHLMNQDHPAYSRFTREMKETLVRNFSVVDFFTTTTDNLADFYMKKVQDSFPQSKTEVAIIPNLISPYLESPKSEDETTFDKVRIGMIVNRHHFPNVNSFKKILLNVQKKYGDKIELINLGWDGKHGMKNVFEKLSITTLPGTTFVDYFNAIRNLKLDFGLIPLKNIPEYNQYKCYQRFLEFAMFKVPVIVGDSDVYTSVIAESEHETIGLISHTETEWMNNIDKMITYHITRKQIGQSAFDFAHRHYSWNNELRMSQLQLIFYPIN